MSWQITCQLFTSNFHATCAWPKVN
jgi:hypothetical protein